MNVNHGITDTGKLKTIEIDKYEPIPDKPGRCRAVGQASKSTMSFILLLTKVTIRAAV